MAQNTTKTNAQQATIQNVDEDAMASRAKRMTTYLKGFLELDATQEEQVYDIQLDIQRKYAELAPYRTSDPELFSDKQIALAKDSDDRLLRILNENQQTIYKQKVVEREVEQARRDRLKQTKNKATNN